MGGLSKKPEGYDEFLQDLKQRVQQARVRAALAVNSEMVRLYWSIGRDILERQDRLGWGAKVIDQLAGDLRREFPEGKGLSARNLKYMRSFAQAWPDEAIVQGALAQITWWHNLALLEKVKDPERRLWYAQKVIENGWSRNSAERRTQSNLVDWFFPTHERRGRQSRVLVENGVLVGAGVTMDDNANRLAFDTTHGVFIDETGEESLYGLE